MTIVGILSDTHISSSTDFYRQHVQKAFTDCTVIIHAGDLTNASILDAFDGKVVHAVHGNMCSAATHRELPHNKLITLDGYKIGICHGAGVRHNIEERVWRLFPDADCIIYGHTHQPVCENKGGVLFINPGSFQSTGPYGAPGTYALLQVEPSGLTARIHNLSFSK